MALILNLLLYVPAGTYSHCPSRRNTLKAIIVDSKRHCRFYCSENNEFDTCGQTRDPVSFVSTSSPSLSSTSSSLSTEYKLNINRDNNILELSFLNLKQKEKPFYIDFRDYIQQRGGSHGHNTHSNVKNELIYKAFGKPLPSTRKYLQQLFSLSESPQSDDFQSIGQSQMGSPSTELVIDLTAGLCRDSTILALCGLDVIAIEKNKLLYDLLTDGMKRYTTEKQHAMLDSRNKLPDLSLSIHHGDSTCAITTHDILLSWLRQQVSIYSLKQQGFHSSSSSFTLKNGPDSITSDGNISSCDNTAWLKEILKSVSISVFLDPMYPAGFVGKKALVKKETQVLHRLVGHSEGDDADGNKRLLMSALSLSTSRVVVKRPLRARPMCDCPPHAVVEGSTQRFDIYFKNRPIQL